METVAKIHVIIPRVKVSTRDAKKWLCSTTNRSLDITVHSDLLAYLGGI